jgi:hypothetical protein
MALPGNDAKLSMASRARPALRRTQRADLHTAIRGARGIGLREAGVDTARHLLSRRAGHDHALDHVGERAGEPGARLRGDGRGQLRHGAALRIERLVGRALDLEANRLAAEKQRRGTGLAAVEREVVRQVMAAQLQHPGRFRAGFAEHGEVVVAAVPADRARVVGRQPIVRQPHFVEQFQAAGGQRGCEHLARGGDLSGVQVAEAQPGAWYDADGQVRPLDGRLVAQWLLERGTLRFAEQRLQLPECGGDRGRVAGAARSLATGLGGRGGCHREQEQQGQG